MGNLNRGRRDGTGPFRGSFQRRNFAQGRRMLAGYDCPFDVKEANSDNGGFRL